MKRIHFYATKEDLVPILLSVESSVPLDYLLMGNFLGDVPKTLSSGTLIPSLGIAGGDTSGVCDQYLVVPRGQRIEIPGSVGFDGRKRRVVDQLANEDSITFTPAGLWGDDVLIHGRVATVSGEKVAQDLMRLFAREVRKKFRRVNAFWVGPHAEAMLDSGKRLTFSAQAPREYDLSRS